jgi:hypothetical protein
MPSPAPDWLNWLLLPPALVFGYFVSGRLMFFRVPSPLPWATAFAGSFLALFGLVLGYDATGVPINLPTLAGGLAGLSLVGWLAAGRPRLRLDLAAGFPPANLRRTDLWWLLPLAAVLASVVVRAVVDPLAGWDNYFRWNHLAFLIAEQGSLAHYPPVNAADFRVYPWCDGIPPGGPILNLWIYLAAGSTAGVLVAGRIAVELALTAALTLRLGHRANGRRGVLVAGVAFVGCSLFAWSVGQAQESGLTCVFVLLLANLVADHRARPARATALWIGLSAGALALCRDYNLLFIPVAILLTATVRAPRSHLFAAIAGALVAAPWYLRNSLLTGNPLFAHDLGGLLPTNPLHAEVMFLIRRHWSLFEHPEVFPFILKVLAIGLGAGAALALPGLGRAARRAPELMLLAATVVALWLLAIPSTAGGWLYSLRILAPLGPLLAALAAHGPFDGRRTMIAGLFLAPCLAADTVRRSWFFGDAPATPALPYDWSFFTPANNPENHDPEGLAVLIRAAAGEGIVIDRPEHVVSVRRRGGQAIAIFSPDLRALTRDTGPLAASVAELRERRIRFVVMTKTSEFNTFAGTTHPALRRLWILPPTADLGAARVYDLAQLNGETPGIVLVP